MIQIQSLSKCYKNAPRKALDSVSLDIYQGEVLGLLGSNGSGKTTLSSILATLIPQSAGDVLYQGKSIYQDINSYRQILGFCPQKTNLNNQLTIEQNLLNDALFYGFSQDAALKKLTVLTKQFSLQDYMQAKPMMLSGGYKQRVSIARALMHEPKFVIFDEPTVGLDPHIRRQLWDVIRTLKSQGITILLTTHYLDEAEQLSDRICLLEKGVLQFIETPEKLKETHEKSNLEDVFVKLMEEESQ